MQFLLFYGFETMGEYVSNVLAPNYNPMRRVGWSFGRAPSEQSLYALLLLKWWG